MATTDNLNTVPSLPAISHEHMNSPTFKQLTTVRPSTQTGVRVFIGSIDDLLSHIEWDSENPDWCTMVHSHFQHSADVLGIADPFAGGQRLIKCTLYRLHDNKMQRPSVYRCSIPANAMRCLWTALANCTPPGSLDDLGNVWWTTEQLMCVRTVIEINRAYVYDYCDRLNRDRGERVSTKLTADGEHATAHSSTNGTANHGRGGKMFNPETERDGRASTGLQLPDQILSGDDIEDVAQRCLLMNNLTVYGRYYDPTDRGAAYLVARTIERVDNEIHKIKMETVSRKTDRVSTVREQVYYEMRFRCLETGLLFSIRSTSHSYVAEFAEHTSIEGPLAEPVTYEETDGLFGRSVVQNPTWIQPGQSARPMEVVYARALRNLKFISRTLYTMLNRQSRKPSVSLYENSIRRTQDEFGKLNRFPLHEMLEGLEWTENQRCLIESQLEHTDHLITKFPEYDVRFQRLAMYNSLRKQADSDFTPIGRTQYFERLKDLYKCIEKRAEDWPFIDEPVVFEYSGQVPSSRRHGGLSDNY